MIRVFSSSSRWHLQVDGWSVQSTVDVRSTPSFSLTPELLPWACYLEHGLPQLWRETLPRRFSFRYCKYKLRWSTVLSIVIGRNPSIGTVAFNNGVYKRGTFIGRVNKCVWSPVLRKKPRNLNESVSVGFSLRSHQRYFLYHHCSEKMFITGLSVLNASDHQM